MRKPFQEISPEWAGQISASAVRVATQRSADRPVQPRAGRGIGPRRCSTPVAAERERKPAPMLPLALLLLIAPSAAAALADSTARNEFEAAHVAAEAAVRAGDYRSAASQYRDILADLEKRPAPDAPEAEWIRALLRLAVVESTLGRVEASRSAMERVLALDPSARLDPELYSPTFRRDFEAARNRVASRPRFHLQVTTRDGSGQGWVQGRPLGAVPVEALLPAGSYRVGVETGGTVRTITLELSRDERVVLDVAAVVAVPPPDLGARPPAAPVPLEPSPSGAWMRPAAWATTGLAVAAAGLATWQGIAAAGSYSEAKGMLQPDGSLKPGVDPAAYAAAANAYQAERRNAWIAGGGALLLGGAATVLWVLAPSSGVEPAPGGLALRF